MKLKKFKKKGALRITLSTIIDLVLVTIAIIALLGIISALMGIFGGSEEKNQASKHNLQAIAAKVNEMKRGDTDQMLVYVDLDHFIVGFDTKKGTAYKGPKGSCMIKDAVKYKNLPFDHTIAENIIKPKSCKNKPCICLCERNKDYGCVDSDFCITDFDYNVDFTGISGSSCSLAFIPGFHYPQKITLKRTGDTVMIYSG